MATEFVFAARSDVGLLRTNNQDSAYAGPRLLVLADGMGGAAGGDIASSVVVAHLAVLDEASGTANTLLENLDQAIQAAHNELVERSQNDSKLRGLGTTCTAILRSGNKLAMAHIGDSRAYLLRDGILTQITTDHSFVQYLIDTGQITKEEAETHPKRNYIMRVLGDAPGEVDVDETIREAVLGDRWLLCSDGLSGVVSEETIRDVLVEYDEPDTCCEKLVELALLGGGPDNVTCIVADVEDSATTPAEPPIIVGAAAIDRHAPSMGTAGAAGRAAALNSPSERVTSEEDEEPTLHHRRRWLGLSLLVLVLAAVALGTGLLWRWSQQQYYVMQESGSVVIFQGIPQRVLSWEFSRPIEVTDLPIDGLSEADRIRLEDPVVRGSLEEIDAYLSEVRERMSLSARTVKVPNLALLEPQSGAQKTPAMSGGE
ncbi:PP2C family protein-serine/threonine phosphatase [Actinomyces minihominis]|uniref:PP2C family protein-serine/threonine phosphatase n=1 Tax=Actinomyces minihominis TaxID=2002838 RepID=UPI000C08D72B|nr:protein phosphatase 2C domain-containing protein [Actinomyces minihominis]